MDLGGNSLNNTADAYGFNSSLNIPGVTVDPSQYDIPPSLALTAYSAIGQFSDTATPLQEAMLAATIANNGVLMKPYLIQQVTSNLSSVYSATPTKLSQPVSPAVANNVKQMMIAVTQQPEGTGYTFNVNNEGGLEIAGKTGTAQNGINASGLDDAVFTAFAPANNPKIAVGVMVKGAGYGAAEAAPIAVSVIKAYLASVGAGG
jgi:penicillin-binding protein A